MLLHATLKAPRLKIAEARTLLDVTPLTVDSATPAIANPWTFDPLPSNEMFFTVTPVGGFNIFRAVPPWTVGFHGHGLAVFTVTALPALAPPSSTPPPH